MTAHAITLSLLPDGRMWCLLTDPADRMVGEVIRRTGGWEPDETALVQALVAPGHQAVDIGAHVGYFTVLLSKLVGRSGRVIAFEPEPGNFELLKANCILNGCANIVLEARAVSDRSGSARLYIAEKNHGDHRLHATPGRSSREVASISFDEYWRDAGRLDFIKLDAQGCEPTILDGAFRTIRANAAHLLCLAELSPGLCRSAGDDLGSVLARIARLDGRVFRLGPGAPGLVVRPLDHAGLTGLWHELLAAGPDDANASLLLAFSDAGCARLSSRLGAAVSSALA